MAQTKQTSKRKRRSKAVPVLGLAGLSVSLASGASASTGNQAADIPQQNAGPRQEVFIGEEELSDVSLSTFYVFDKENAARPQANEKVAWWRGCGCRCGCRACRCGCGGCWWVGCRC